MRLGRRRAREGMILLNVLVIVAIVFIATNTNRVTFTVFWVDISQPLWMLLTVTVLVGFVIGWFVGRRRK